MLTIVLSSPPMFTVRPTSGVLGTCVNNNNNNNDDDNNNNHRQAHLWSLGHLRQFV